MLLSSKETKGLPDAMGVLRFDLLVSPKEPSVEHHGLEYLRNTLEHLGTPWNVHT